MAKLTLGVNIEEGKILFDFHNGVVISPVDDPSPLLVSRYSGVT